MSVNFDDACCYEPCISNFAFGIIVPVDISAPIGDGPTNNIMLTTKLDKFSCNILTIDHYLRSNDIIQNGC